MCGRTACTLAPGDVCTGCTFTDKKTGKKSKPQWRDAPGGKQYYTSYNIGPGTHTPILLSGKHFTEKDFMSEELGEEEGGSVIVPEYVVQPMQWGLVPSWHKGDAKATGYSMINARSDGLLQKSSFKTPLQKGRRCVVIVDGYFEWQKKKDGSKQPYFIYLPQGVATKTEDVKTGGITEGTDSSRRILMLAGIFDRWHPKDGGEPLYSYSIITTESHKTMSWLHDRMPAILENEEEVRDWLDFGRIDLNQAMKLIRPSSCVTHHPVSSVVNNVRNKTPECIQRVDPEKAKKSAGSQFMSAWLNKGQTKKRPSTEGDKIKGEGQEKPAEDTGEPAAKKVKEDPEGE